MADTKKLFKNVVEKLNSIIENGEIGDDGVKKDASPAYFSQAINILKHVGEVGAEDKPSIKDKLKGLALPYSLHDDETDGTPRGAPRH